MRRARCTSFDSALVGRMSTRKTVFLLVVLMSLGLMCSVFAQEEAILEDAAQVDVAQSVAAGPIIEAFFGSDFDRETRTLVGQAEEFGSDVEQIYCLTRIKGLKAPATVTHAWYHEGQVKARVELNVGSADWRTWSSKKIMSVWTGDWEVKVLDSSGKVMAKFGFTVK